MRVTLDAQMRCQSHYIIGTRFSSSVKFTGSIYFFCGSPLYRCVTDDFLVFSALTIRSGVEDAVLLPFRERPIELDHCSIGDWRHHQIPCDQGDRSSVESTQA